jgi:putative ABC transport system permease protein
MFALAIRSIRQRPGRFLATLLAAFLGATITMTFNSMHDTATGVTGDSIGTEALRLAGGVVGGYGTLLVFFAIASTLTVNVRQREKEIELLRRTGATPAQITRMVVGESAMVALLGMLLAIWPAMLGGRALLGVFQDSGQVSEKVDYVFGPIALTAGVGITLVAAVGAAFLAVHRATRAAAGGRAPRLRLRTIAGAAALVAGVGGVCTTLAFDSADPALMAPAAYGAILLSIGFATFCPALLRMLLDRPGQRIADRAGASVYLSVHNVRRRATELAGVLMPLVTFTGVATATLYMQAIENDAIKASGIAKSVEDKNLETVNLIVVGIIVAFACIMLINSLYAAISYRAEEFGRQRLAGATPGQVLATVAVEGLMLTVTGVFFGTIAGVAGILPFNLVRTDSVFPDQGPAIWLGTVAVAVAATLVTSVATAAKALRTPAVAAVTVAA